MTLFICCIRLVVAMELPEWPVYPLLIYRENAWLMPVFSRHLSL